MNAVTKNSRELVHKKNDWAGIGVVALFFLAAPFAGFIVRILLGGF